MSSHLFCSFPLPAIPNALRLFINSLVGCNVLRSMRHTCLMTAQVLVVEDEGLYEGRGLAPLTNLCLHSQRTSHSIPLVTPQRHLLNGNLFKYPCSKRHISCQRAFEDPLYLLWSSALDMLVGLSGHIVGAGYHSVLHFSASVPDYFTSGILYTTLNYA